MALSACVCSLAPNNGTPNGPKQPRQVALDKEEGFVKHIFGKEILGGAQAPRKRPKSG
jgi:hypothetical protein